MKLTNYTSGKSDGRHQSGFTLAEMLVTVLVFSFIIAAMVAVQIFGLRIYTLAATKLLASQSGRQTLGDIRDRLRSCKTVYVGIYTNSQFSQIPTGSPQMGNAVQIFPTEVATGTNFIVFYQDPVNTNICMITNGVIRVTANFVTNFYVFQAEDYQGNVLTNYQNNPVIKMTMSFVEWEYPIGFIGGNAINAYDFYYLRTRITRRSKF